VVVISSLSQQHPDLPVLGSLLAGLLLPVHDDHTESHDVTASSRSSTVTSRSCGPLWTPNQLLPITHGLRAGACVAEICERLQELDEISKRYVDVLEHFVVTSCYINCRLCHCLCRRSAKQRLTLRPSELTWAVSLPV